MSTSIQDTGGFAADGDSGSVHKRHRMLSKAYVFLNPSFFRTAPMYCLTLSPIDVNLVRSKNQDAIVLAHSAITVGGKVKVS